MFSRRRQFSQQYKFDRKFIEKFVTDLQKAGFDSINVLLPHNLVTESQDSITIDEFINRERNYPSVILIAQNSNNEVIKVLFINTSTKAFFKDDTFPSGHSEPPELYIQSSDPARTYALFEFFYEYLRKNGKRKIFSSPEFSFLIPLLFLIYEVVSKVSKDVFILSDYFKIPVWVDYTAIALGLIIIFLFFSKDNGFYIKEKEHKYASMVRRAIRGDFRDNPIITLIIVVIGTFIAAVLSEFFISIWRSL